MNELVAAGQRVVNNRDSYGNPYHNTTGGPLAVSIMVIDGGGVESYCSIHVTAEPSEEAPTEADPMTGWLWFNANNGKPAQTGPSVSSGFAVVPAGHWYRAFKYPNSCNTKWYEYPLP